MVLLFLWPPNGPRDQGTPHIWPLHHYSHIERLGKTYNTWNLVGIIYDPWVYTERRQSATCFLKWFELIIDVTSALSILLWPRMIWQRLRSIRMVSVSLCVKYQKRKIDCEKCTQHIAKIRQLCLTQVCWSLTSNFNAVHFLQASSCPPGWPRLKHHETDNTHVKLPLLVLKDVTSYIQNIDKV